jgi:MFS family permease
MVNYFAFSTFLASAMGFFVQPWAGRASDAHGRRPLLLLAAVLGLLKPLALFAHISGGLDIRAYYLAGVPSEALPPASLLISWQGGTPTCPSPISVGLAMRLVMRTIRHLLLRASIYCIMYM